jgi:hypothetical protein
MERMQLICRAFGKVLPPNECKRREYSRTAGKRNRTWSSDKKKDERKLQETNKRGGKRPHTLESLVATNREREKKRHKIHPKSSNPEMTSRMAFRDRQLVDQNFPRRTVQEKTHKTANGTPADGHWM